MKSPAVPAAGKLDDNGVAVATDFQRAVPQFLAVLCKNLLLFGYGMTLGFPTIVIPAIQGGDGRDPNHDIVLSHDQISWFSSINLLCVPLGCIFSGTFTQPIGKRRAMQLVNLPILGSWLLFYFSTDIWHLYAGLCLFGLSGGLMEAPVLTYVAEVTEPRYRGMLAATGSTCLILGVFTQFILGSFLKWRTIAAVSTIFPILSITALFFVPESPHWLLTKGRTVEAQKALAWLRGWVPVNQVKVEYDEIYDLLVLQPAHNSANNSSGRSACDQTVSRYLKKSFMRPYALIALTFFIGHFSGKTTLQTYAVQIFHTLKAPIDKYYATILLGAAEIVGTLICVVLVHFTGKRPLVLISTVGCGLCFLGTATYAHFLDSIPGVAVTNVVANVSLVEVQHDAVDRNMTSEIPDWLLANSTEEYSRKLENETHQRVFKRQINVTHLVLMMDPLASEELESTTSAMLNLILQNNETMLDALIDTNQTVSLLINETATESLPKLQKNIVLEIPNVEQNRFLWLPLTLLLFSAMFAHMGIKLIPWMLIGEVFPAAVRSGASGISSGTGYLFGFAANKLFLGMLATMTMPGTFWFYSAVALLGAVILYFVLPETEGQTLLDIERHFVDGAPLSPVTSMAPIVHVAAQTALGCTVASFQDHIVSNSPASGGGGIDMKKVEGRRLFQKHLDEHRIRLDGHRHNHVKGGNGVRSANNTPVTEINFTPPQWRQEEARPQRDLPQLANGSEMTHF